MLKKDDKYSIEEKKYSLPLKKYVNIYHKSIATKTIEMNENNIYK